MKRGIHIVIGWMGTVGYGPVTVAAALAGAKAVSEQSRNFLTRKDGDIASPMSLNQICKNKKTHAGQTHTL